MASFKPNWQLGCLPKLAHSATPIVPCGASCGPARQIMHTENMSTVRYSGIKRNAPLLASSPSLCSPAAPGGPPSLPPAIFPTSPRHAGSPNPTRHRDATRTTTRQRALTTLGPNWPLPVFSRTPFHVCPLLPPPLVLGWNELNPSNGSNQRGSPTLLGSPACVLGGNLLWVGGATARLVT